ncbi:hypothetical protein Sjap_008179 [Stephania japonica]|uniref:Uncharacterized protein n=1 Tax=Stephania japonica TaxID=461633 RepID=A0AAP0JPU3_9MAGN
MRELQLASAAKTFDEASMERSKSFIKALQIEEGVKTTAVYGHFGRDDPDFTCPSLTKFGEEVGISKFTSNCSLYITSFCHTISFFDQTKGMELSSNMFNRFFAQLRWSAARDRFEFEFIVKSRGKDSFYLKLSDEKLRHVHEHNFNHPDEDIQSQRQFCVGTPDRDKRMQMIMDRISR